MPVFRLCVEAGAHLHPFIRLNHSVSVKVWTEVAVAGDAFEACPCVGFSLLDALEDRGFLRRRTRVFGLAFGIQPTFVTDTNGDGVRAGHVRSNLAQRPADMNSAILRNESVVAAAFETTSFVVTDALLKGVVSVLSGRTAMDNDKADVAFLAHGSKFYDVVFVKIEGFKSSLNSAGIFPRFARTDLKALVE